MNDFYYYGVVVIVGEKIIFDTTIQNEAIITLESNLYDSIDYIYKKKGVNVKPIEVSNDKWHFLKVKNNQYNNLIERIS